MLLQPYRGINYKIQNDTDCDINIINDTCYGICNSYGNIYGDVVRNNCESECRNIISQVKLRAGLNDCDFRKPSPPVIWNRYSRNFPKFLKNTNDPKLAYKLCIYDCKRDNECKESCGIDYNSICSNCGKELFDLKR